ncbi:MAG: CRISPR-associated protein [bacterium]|nr:MAG: CRISPR-associated protein [bacterium]
MEAIKIMSTLLMRLAGPMQSWGTQSRFSIRDTGQEPSKSGVIGLLCAALGKPRQEKLGDSFPTLSQLASLKMAVRVDQSGIVKRDFQTAGGSHLKLDKDYGVIKADAKSRGTVVSERFYLSNADFLVGLESDNQELLERLSYALAHPYWQLCLGRKAFVPALPVYIADGLKNTELLETIKHYPWNSLKLYPSKKPDEKLQLVSDITEETGNKAHEVRHDVPISFLERRFTIRYTRTEYIDVPTGGD